MILALLCAIPTPQQPTAPPIPQPETAPFQLWTSPAFPQGFDFGEAVGMSLGDWNADGWVDVFAFSSGHLWKNEGGQNWSFANDLDSVLPAASVRYGAAFGDFNADGLPDIVTEPRKGGGDSCLHLLRNEGGSLFHDIAGDPTLLNWQPCGALAETALWGDVDADGDLDLFFPTYQASKGSIDNRFLQNLGPVGPQGQTAFFEDGPGFGVSIPSGASNPEGAQFLDLDHDGDLDLFSNGHLYLNQSAFGQPLFEWLKSGVSGIRKRGIIDEGSVLTDYDLDGDFDLLQNYTSGRGFRIWRNQGDGTFEETLESLIENHTAGASFGIGVCDFDLDGDEDFIGLDIIRENIAAQGGSGFRIVPNPIPAQFTTGGVPGWADWDRDGDSDLFLANGAYGTWLFENTTYQEDTPSRERRQMRVRAVKGSPGVPRGLETEYGTVIECVPRNQSTSARWVRTVSSSGGYINQNEYDVTFAFPNHFGITETTKDIRFDLFADFPSIPSEGFHRVDARVNPVLSNLRLANLGNNRTLTLEREGVVHLQGLSLAPQPPVSPTLQTTGVGLAQARQAIPLPDMKTTTEKDWFVGIEIEVDPGVNPLEVVEIWLDGAPIARSHEEPNAFIWDITQPAQAHLLLGGQVKLQNRGDNDRIARPVMWRLQPGHRYRIVARVSRWRETSLNAPIPQGAFSLEGGLYFNNPNPKAAQAVLAANLDLQKTSVALRLAEAGADWRDLGHGSFALQAVGPPIPRGTIQLSLQGVTPTADVTLILGRHAGCMEYTGGRAIIPSIDQVLSAGKTDALGNLTQTVLLPFDLKPGDPIFLQALIDDPSAPFGKWLTHALVARARWN